MEPRIEPEIVFHLATAPRPEMSDLDLLACTDWLALGFEIVQSIFPDWAFSVADAVAAEAVHAGLLLGLSCRIPDDRLPWLAALEAFSIELKESRGIMRSGYAASVKVPVVTISSAASVATGSCECPFAPAKSGRPPQEESIWPD
jgi:2-keto-4-pentenoate hydratase